MIFRKKKVFSVNKKQMDSNEYHIAVNKLSKEELKKSPTRTDVINYLLSISNQPTHYLEIGVRNPEDNFNKIIGGNKYSVDPGIEFEENPVDFKMTSDEFFDGLNSNKLLGKEIRFDVIFIDGLHLASQVYKDVYNSLDFLTDDGFIIVHDCNPPTEWHARETHDYRLSPAKNYWNGTVWKAFYKLRFDESISTCCIDSDWGIGIVTKRRLFSCLKNDFNPFCDFYIFNSARRESLNLISFADFKSNIKK